MRKSLQGLTMVEAMVTIAIIAIVSAIAVPSFTNIIHSSRLSDYGVSFVASTHLARGEALKTNATVSMCASQDGSTCILGDATAWRKGWIVFRDANSDGIVDTDERIVQVQGALLDTYKFTADQPGALNFQSTAVGTTSVTMTLCKYLPDVNANQRQIFLNIVGKTTVIPVTSTTC